MPVSRGSVNQAAAIASGRLGGFTPEALRWRVQAADTRSASHRYDANAFRFGVPWSQADALMNQIDEILFIEYLANIEVETKNDLDARANYFSAREDAAI